LFKNSGTGVTERVEKPSRRRINGYVVMKYLSKNEPRKRVVSARARTFKCLWGLGIDSKE
jgi:hypothetical protein